ncbi:MAG TPA: hypothetical protein VMZ73_10500 [Acidimicrobiales bacterium]|nr:hypothetical protein [Acidimicrobiales bacterium]
MSRLQASTVDVLDAGELVRIAFEDLVKYHGRGSIGGLAHGFKVMERGFTFLDDGNAPERREVHVETAFDGPGSRDAFEMVTRAVTGGRYIADVNLAGTGPPAPEAPQGRFFFRLGYRGRIVELTLRGGHVSHEFLELVRRGPDSAAEQEHLARMKQEMADRLMGLAAEDVYDATSL